MPPAFLTRPRELLTADGGFMPLDQDAGAAWRRPLVLLARELCSFAWFETGRAKGSAAAAAARLHARATAPFSDPGFLLRRGPGGFGIWSWDMDRVGPQLKDRYPGRAPLVSPESLAQPPGDGWRIVRATPGYEAQCWISNVLVGSAWRRQPFDDTAWRSFTRVQRGPTAPPSPPPALTLPLSQTPDLGDFALAEISMAETARVAAVSLAVVFAGAAGLLAGQALRLRGLADAAEAQAAAVRAATPQSVSAARRASLRLAAFRKLSDRPNLLSALSSALEVLQLYRVEPMGFEIDGDSLTLTLPYSAIGETDRIASELEASGAFSDARPLTDADAQVINLKLQLRRAPVTPTG
ncbi:MAG TPA: hypothetical protein VIJ94_10175 [Caulobacteraceae bacterium]